MIELGIYNEDCLETMKRMAADEVDYCLTSPPYNFDNSNGNLGKKYQSVNDKRTQADYYEWQKKVINEMLRVTKHYVFYNIQMLSGNKLALFNLLGCFASKIKEVIIWDKGHAEPAIEPNVLNSVFEFIIVFSKRDADIRKFRKCEFHGNIQNIFRIHKHRNSIGIDHHAIMPLELARKIILAFTNEGDIIYDPFAGSGTTLIAAYYECRRWLGSELSPQYFRDLQERMKPYLVQNKLFKQNEIK